MRFTIISTKPGHELPQNSCVFYPPGGTIGRGKDNNLVLPDNDRTISRLQAIVHVTADGECRITNRGNVTQVVLNDSPLEREHQIRLQHGDILTIDEYRIEIHALNQEQDNQAINPVVASAQQQPVNTQPVVTSTSVPSLTPTPVSIEAVPQAIPTEIWDNLMQEFSVADSGLSEREKPQSATTHDPFAESESVERNPEDPLAIFKHSEPSLERQIVETDKLFTDEVLFKNDSILDDITPTTLVSSAENTAESAMAEVQAELDPLALFGIGTPTETMQSGNMLLTPVDTFTAPESVSEPMTLPDPDVAFDASLFAEQPAKTGGSQTADISVIKSVPVEAVPPVERESLSGITLPMPQTVLRNAMQPPEAKGRLRIDPVQNKSSAAMAQSGPANGDVLQGELLNALLEGMGLGDMQPVPQFDRENMRQLGQILSMFSQGTVALLSSRSILKRGVKADMTMVLDDANNPFKLLPSGKTVLMQMFGSHMPGFMSPRRSVRDALIDLQAHQLGMISGIRAILAAMLQSFNPKQLEEESRREGATPRLSLPASRKAALWDYFVRIYGETAGEIEDDFHTIFGEAFLYAYDMEVNQYKDSQSGSEE